MINEKPLSVVLLLILVVTPWCYGGVDESTQFWIALGLAVLGVASLVLPKSKVPHRLIIATIPLGLAFAWGLFQLIPWPRFVANFVSPRTVELRLELDVDPETVATRPTQLHAFSLHPAATRYHLALFSLGVGGFYLGATLFRTPSAVLWLCGAVAVNGAALSIFGLIQKLTWNGRIYWVGPVPLGYSVFASFVNRNHAGGYLNLCLAGAIGATIWSITRRPADSERSVREWPAVSDWRVFRIFAAVLSVFILAGIFATLSRGAMVALVVGVLIIAAGFATSGRPKTQLAWIAAIFAAGFVIVAWAGMYEPLKDRLGTLVQKDELISSGRLPNWIDALRSLPDFWHTGSGLGTYRDIYPLYQHRFDARVYSYAENQYLQALIEAGFPGLLLMLAQIILVALACRKLIGGGSDHASFAAGMAATFALSTQVIQGLFDWGLYLPSNMLLLAVFCGACVTFAGHGDRNVGKPLSRTSRWYFPAFGRVTLAILIGLLIYSAIEFRGAARVENALRYAK
jgi:O-antigen ligase